MSANSPRIPRAFVVAARWTEARRYGREGRPGRLATDGIKLTLKRRRLFVDMVNVISEREFCDVHIDIAIVGHRGCAQRAHSRKS